MKLSQNPLLLKLVAALLMLGCKSNPPKSLTDKAWYEALPTCPCENPDSQGTRFEDGWAVDAGDISTYHAGATICFRSYPPTPTIEGQSGQQCCYDEEGRLITAGSGAGTPDKVSTCNGEKTDGQMDLRMSGIIGHYNKDVVPWQKMGGKADGWEKYNEHFPPNNKGNCPENEVTLDAMNIK